MAKRFLILVAMLTAMLAAIPALAQETTAPQYQYEDGERAAGSSATFTYELTVECEPPADAEFLGFTATESLVTTPLTDPDGDGVYTGSQTVPRFAPGGPPEPITISPVRIVQGPPTGSSAMGPEYRIIEDFGAVTAEDATFSASVSFCGDDGGSGGATSGGETTGIAEDTNGPAAGGQYEDGGGTAEAVGIDLNEDGVVSEADDEFAAQTSERGVATTPEEGALPGTGGADVAGVLPSTGGILPVVGLAGLLIVAGGLVVRKKFAR